MKKTARSEALESLSDISIHVDQHSPTPTITRSVVIRVRPAPANSRVDFTGHSENQDSATRWDVFSSQAGLNVTQRHLRYRRTSPHLVRNSHLRLCFNYCSFKGRLRYLMPFDFQTTSGKQRGSRRKRIASGAFYLGCRKTCAPVWTVPKRMRRVRSEDLWRFLSHDFL